MTVRSRTIARILLLTGLLWGLAFCAAGSEITKAGEMAMNGEAMNLTAEGEPRKLAPDLFGLNAPSALYEYVVEDVGKIAPVKELAPATLRFPGGTIANYYNWRTGQIDVPIFPDSSVYTQIMHRTGQNIAQRLRPAGMSLDRFSEFARSAGARVLLVPNLETSSIDEQVAWFRHLKEEGLLPRYLEMGNEFWVAMLMDPHVIEKFPDARTTMGIIKEYADALRPYLPPGTKIAVQSAGSELRTTQGGGQQNALMQRMAKWDREMEDAPWFDALTVRLYPEVDNIYGPGGYDALPGGVTQVYPAMLTHVDEGLDRMFRAISARFPGKEIWMSEWSANGTSFFFLRRNPGLKGMMIQTTIRIYLSILRAPEVTVSSMHMMSFEGGPWALWRKTSGGGFKQVGPALAMTWFHQAANGGAKYRRVTAGGGPRIEGTGAATGLSCNAIEGALLTHDATTVLLIQNAGADAIAVSLEGLGIHARARVIETFATPDLMQDFGEGVPLVHHLPIADQIALAPYSLTRVVWDAS